MRVAENDWDDRAGLRGHMQLNRYTGRERERERDCHIMRRTRAQEREARDRIGEGGGDAKKGKKPQESYRRDVENGEDY